MQLDNLEAYGRELDMTIEELTKGLPVRKKLYQSLGIMGGLFLAILFLYRAEIRREGRVKPAWR